MQIQPRDTLDAKVAAALAIVGYILVFVACVNYVFWRKEDPEGIVIPMISAFIATLFAGYAWFLTRMERYRILIRAGVGVSVIAILIASSVK